MYNEEAYFKNIDDELIGIRLEFNECLEEAELYIKIGDDGDWDMYRYDDDQFQKLIRFKNISGQL